MHFFYCSPYTLQIIDNKSLKFSKLKGKINFGSKLYFSYFLALSVKEVRKSC
jgi:hypothetical protein